MLARLRIYYSPSGISYYKLLGMRTFQAISIELSADGLFSRLLTGTISLSKQSLVEVDRMENLNSQDGKNLKGSSDSAWQIDTILRARSRADVSAQKCVTEDTLKIL